MSERLSWESRGRDDVPRPAGRLNASHTRLIQIIVEERARMAREALERERRAS